MIRRLIGLILILVGVSGLTLCYLGAKAAREVADDLATSADGLLETAGDTLATIEQSLEQSRQTVASVTETVEQVRITTADLAYTADDTQPTMDELALLVGEVVPGTITDVQNTIPNIAQTAKVVDDTLRLLSRVKIEERVPIINYDISIGLGVDYDPEIPFDEAVEDVGRGLDPIAASSGRLESGIRTTGANIALLSQDLTALTGSLEQLNEEISAFRPLLDEYSSLIEDTQRGLTDGQRQLREQLEAAKKAVVIVAVWLSLFQLLPLYFGLELLLGNRMVQIVETRPPAVGDQSGDSSDEEAPPDASDGGPFE